MTNVSIKTTAIELTPALKDYAEKRLSSIGKFTEGDAEVTLDIGKTTAHHKGGEIFAASAHITTALGRQYHASSNKADLYEAIDDVRDEIVREIKHVRGKKDSLLRRGARRIKRLIKGLR
ncbi:ribosome-associated translation inhibitor RaiA [Candidatus Nomurabacteria bacterium]|nr:ribosome-associated translation inhibitor RaiA [Candidatus Nomurabacteria bacterium]